MKEIKCFLCNEDITNKVKCLSYSNFPDKAWDEVQKDWVKNYRELFNGVMCQECAKKDLETAHQKHNRKQIEKEMQDKFDQQLKDMPKYYKLFGRIYIRL